MLCPVDSVVRWVLVISSGNCVGTLIRTPLLAPIFRVCCLRWTAERFCAVMCIVWLRERSGYCSLAERMQGQTFQWIFPLRSFPSSCAFPTRGPCGPLSSGMDSPGSWPILEAFPASIPLPFPSGQATTPKRRPSQQPQTSWSIPQVPRLSMGMTAL